MENVKPQMTALKEIHPSPWNPRLIKDKKFEQLCKSMEEEKDYLWCRPVIANKDGMIIGGNMRYRAAEKLGWDSIPTIFIDVSEAKAKKLAILDNGEFGEWNNDELATLLDEMEKAGTDLSLLGLDDSIQKIIEELSFSDKNKEINIGSFDGMMELKFSFSEDQYYKVVDKLRALNDSKEIALLKLLDV